MKNALYMTMMGMLTLVFVIGWAIAVPNLGSVMQGMSFLDQLTVGVSALSAFMISLFVYILLMSKLLANIED